MICSGLFYLKSLRNHNLFIEDDYINSNSLDISCFDDMTDSNDNLIDMDSAELRTDMNSDSIALSSLRGSPSTSLTSTNQREPSERARTKSREKKNINMMSAFTHILGDTLRTVAVFLAALVSSLTGIDGDKCDVSHSQYASHLL